MSEKSKMEHEIDLVELAKEIWSRRRFLIKSLLAFLTAGVFFALSSKVEYEASCKLIPENQEGLKKNLGGLGGLAGIAGINLGSGTSSALTPDLYPDIVKSVPFQLDLVHRPLLFEKIDSTVSSYVFFREIERPSILDKIAEYSIGLPRKVKSLFANSVENSYSNYDSTMVRLSREDSKLLDSFKERLEISVNAESGVMMVKSEMPDPYAAAQLTNILVERLTDQIVRYKIQKVQENLDFTLERYREAEERYDNVQRKLAKFTDQNRNVRSSLGQTEYQRLQNELNIAFEVYKGLATQLEQDKISVKQKTPIFTILEPVKVPYDKSKPRRTFIVVVSAFMGLFVGVSFLIISHIYLKFLKNGE